MSVNGARAPLTPQANLTWVEHIAQGAVIKNHDFAEVRLNLSKVLDVSPVAKRAVLSVVAPREVLPLDLQPVDDGIGVLLY
jgi:hypothetical protein